MVKMKVKIDGQQYHGELVGTIRGTLEPTDEGGGNRPPDGEVTLESVGTTSFDLTEGDDAQLQADVSNMQSEDVNVDISFKFGDYEVATAQDTVGSGVVDETAAEWVHYNGTEIESESGIVTQVPDGEYVLQAVLQSGDTWDEQTTESGSMHIGDSSGSGDYEMQREHKYTIEATGSEPVQYYLDVEDGADFLASPVDGSDNAEGAYWISGDETKVAGEIPAGSKHGWEFNNYLLDAEINGGEFTALVNDEESSLEYFPYDGAAGDYWKYYFSWNIDDEPARDNWYSIEATGSEPVEYYIEKETTGGGYLPSLENGATITYDDFWIDHEGEESKAAGIIHPGDTHAFEFDGDMLDVDLRGGSANAYVNGSESSLDIYPQDGASGDGWKDPALWTDAEEPSDGGGTGGDDGSDVTGDGGDVIGGGYGYTNIVTSDQADYTVTTLSELENALSSAASGEVVYVPEGETIDIGTTRIDVPGGVTLASNRGGGGDLPAGLIYSWDDVWGMIRCEASGARISGLRIRGAYPAQTVTADDGLDGWSYDDEDSEAGHAGIRITTDDVEVDNNKIWGCPSRGVSVDGGSGGNHIHHNFIHDCNGGGYGYGVAVNGSSSNPLIERNYFDNCRHCLTASGDNYGYIARYNHFGPTQVMTTMDIHDGEDSPYGAEYTIMEGNINECMYRTWDDNCNSTIGGFDSTGGLDVIDNWFWQDACPWGYDSAAEGDIYKSGNVLGENADVTFSDIIPNHPGRSHRPW